MSQQRAPIEFDKEWFAVAAAVSDVVNLNDVSLAACLAVYKRAANKEPITLSINVEPSSKIDTTSKHLKGRSPRRGKFSAEL